MNIETGEIKDRGEIAKLLKDIPETMERRLERAKYAMLGNLTPEQMEQVRRMTPAERVAAKVRGTFPFADAQPDPKPKEE